MEWVCGFWEIFTMKRNDSIILSTVFTYSDRDEIGVAEAEVEMSGHA